MISLSNRKFNLTEAARSLHRHGVSPDFCSTFVDYATSASRATLCHANPRYLAEQLAAPLRATLALLLAAVDEGLARLHWDVQCPKCGGLDHRRDSLTQLHREGECLLCHATFPQRLDVEVRVTFTMQQQAQGTALWIESFAHAYSFLHPISKLFVEYNDPCVRCADLQVDFQTASCARSRF